MLVDPNLDVTFAIHLTILSATNEQHRTLKQYSYTQRVHQVFQSPGERGDKMVASSPRRQEPSPRQQKPGLLRSLAIVGLACTTVSFFTYWYLHGHTLIVQDQHKLSERLAQLPVILGDAIPGRNKHEPTLDPTKEKTPDPPKVPRSVPGENAPETQIGNMVDETSEKPAGMDKSSQPSTPDSRAEEYPGSTSPFAYGFVIGGCDPGRIESYQNYLFNIAIAAKILRERGSTADVIALFQVSESAKTHELAPEDLRLLHALGVYVYYIPQQTHGQQSFYRTQLDKFRILGLTQYERVLFLDGDVMPIANLDYMFEMSVNGTLQDNIVLQGIHEPANGGKTSDVHLSRVLFLLPSPVTKHWSFFALKVSSWSKQAHWRQCKK